MNVLRAIATSALTVAATAVAAAVVHLPSAAADTSVLEALRGARSAELVARLREGADASVRDESGATALMYAALYSSVDDVLLLLSRGVDVNAADSTGATALMWAVSDDAKLRTMLEHGANVNARTRSNGTALLVAVRLGNVPAIRQLLAAHADVATDADALLNEAYLQSNPAVLTLLRTAGLNTTDPSRLMTLLASSASMITPGFAERLVTAGAPIPRENVRGVRIFNAPLLGFAAQEFGLPLTKLVLERGADPNQKASRGITPLMMAAGASEPDAAVIQALLDHGADVTATDESGQTALDWALLQGETPAAGLLRRAGAHRSSSIPSVPTSTVAPRTVGEAVEAAVAHLLPASATFVERGHCISCHNQSLPAVAVAVAQAHHIAVDAELGRQPNEVTARLWAPRREEVLLAHTEGVIGGFNATVPYALLGFAEANTPPSLLTDALAIGLAGQQQPNGSWNVGDVRPPLFDTSAIHYTALAIRALSQYMPAGRRREAETRIDRARHFLEAVAPRQTQDEAFKLLGLVWAKAGSHDIAVQRDRVVGMQRQDGGWAQRPTMGSDPYQTGQVLYALHAGGIAPTSATYRRGVDYLLRGQLADGTWAMQSRAFAVQPYFESGFPHSRNQFISAAATAWAAIALAYAN